MPVLKVAVFLCAVGCVWSMINVRGDVPWFQQFLNQGNRPNNNLLGTSGNNGFMMGLLRGRNSRCNGTGASSLAEGVCQSKRDCKKAGGTASGTCNLVGNCCIIENTCSNDTNAKVSYFVSPAKFQNICPMRVRLFNKNVCQIRLDFERFSTQGPFLNSTDYNCKTDMFTINGAGKVGFNALCGDNTGQHIYISVNGPQVMGEVVLNFELEMDRSGLVQPDWRIKVTQLECESGVDELNMIQSSLTSLYQNIKTKRKNNSKRDKDMIAPPGCLQYHTESEGTYTSFNYNSGLGPMPGSTNYAICFKRSSNTCGISHFAKTFNVSGNEGNDALGLGQECIGAPGNSEMSNDWVLIPGGALQDKGTSISNDYYCVDSLSQKTVISRVPGPLYVVVNTDSGMSVFSEAGFAINYNIQDQC